LEELERNSHMESILQDNKHDIINNIIQLESLDADEGPDDDAKRAMSEVMHELKAKVKIREAQVDVRQDVANNNNKTKNIYDKFMMATNVQDMPWNRESDDDEQEDGYMDQLNAIEMEMRDASHGKVKKKRKKSKSTQQQRHGSPSSSSGEEEVKSMEQSLDDFHLNVDKFDRHSQSSGVTSGPDSPIQSDDESLGSEGSPKTPANGGAAIVQQQQQQQQHPDYDQFKQHQKNEQLLEHSQQPTETEKRQYDDRGACAEVQLDSAAAEAELKSGVGGAEVRKKPTIQLSQTISTDSTNQDSGISDTSGASAAMSSKWKLLKTLKERKEMNNQVKIKEEEETCKDKKVSAASSLLTFHHETMKP